MSSWWAAIHGYRHPALDAARRASRRRVAHVMFGGLTHEPARPARRSGWSRSPPTGLRARLLRRLRFGQRRGRAEDGAAVPARRRPPRAAPGCSPSAAATTATRSAAMSVCDPVGGMHSMFTDVLPRQVFADRPAGRPTPTSPPGPRRSTRLADAARPRAGRDHRRAGAAGRRRHARLLRRVPARCCARWPTSTAWCWSSTRSPPASAAPARCFAAEPPASRPTSCASARR